jgi:hemoglobin
MPDDETFRRRFLEYVEWGSKIALQYQDPGETLPHGEPVPRWGWR